MVQPEQPQRRPSHVDGLLFLRALRRCGDRHPLRRPRLPLHRGRGAGPRPLPSRPAATQLPACRPRFTVRRARYYTRTTYLRAIVTCSRARGAACAHALRKQWQQDYFLTPHDCRGAAVVPHDDAAEAAARHAHVGGPSPVLRRANLRAALRTPPPGALRTECSRVRVPYSHFFFARGHQ